MAAMGMVQSTHSYDPNQYSFLNIDRNSPHVKKVEKVFKEYALSFEKISSDNNLRCEALFYSDQLKGLIVYKKNLQNPFKKKEVVNSLCLQTFIVLESNKDLMKSCETTLLKRVTTLAQRAFAQSIHTITTESSQTLQTLERNDFKIIKTWESVVKGETEHLLTLTLPAKQNRIKVNQEEEKSPKAEKLPTSKKRKRSSETKREEAPNSASEKDRHSQRSSERDYYSKRRRRDDWDRDSRYSYEHRRNHYSARGPVQNNYGAKPAQTHEITLKRKYIHQIKFSGKTIEGRINSGMIRRFKEGDQVRFFYKQNERDDVRCKIKAIRPYSSFRDMLTAEGVTKCLTDIYNLEEGVRVYDCIPGYSQRAAQNGVVAIEIQKV
jgi:ASC-1-like (ASCH) protein